MKTIRRLMRDCGGAVAAEYALILGIVGAAIASAAYVLATSVAGAMGTVASLITP
jgi:pilus assembly protein Flp/PilA